MLRSGPIACASRVAAVLVALSLSGGLGVAGALAPESSHHCACRARRGAEHRCTCPVCARIAARAADDRALEGLPPCHRAAARRARDEARRSDRERASREREVPGVREDCGQGDDAALGLRALEAFTVPSAPGVVAPEPAGWAGWLTRLTSGAAPAPEPPPPRT